MNVNTDPLFDELEKFCYPVFGAGISDFEQIGSSVMVRLDETEDSWFLLNTKHTFSGRSEIAVKALDRFFILTENNTIFNQKLDIAATYITSFHTGGLDSMPLSMELFKSAIQVASTKYIKRTAFFGYPCEKNTITNGTYTQYPLLYTSTELDTMSKTFLFANFNEDNVTSHENQKIRPPDFTGMSGGAVIEMYVEPGEDGLDDFRGAYLSGIGIEKNEKKWLKATKREAIFDWLNTMKPHKRLKGSLAVIYLDIFKN